MEKTSISRSFALLSGSSVAMIVGSVIATKAFAMLVGASGLGVFNVLQGVLALATIIAAMGVGAAVTQTGAAALSRGDAMEATSIRRAAWLVAGSFTSVVSVLMLIFHDSIRRAVSGETISFATIALLVVALFFNVAWTLETSILTAYHRVNAMARIGFFKGFVATLSAPIVVWIGRERGIAPAIAVSAGLNWAASRYLLKREGPLLAGGTTTRDVSAAAGALLRFGLPFTASSLAGAGIQYVLPILVLRTSGVQSAGFYAAAAMIAVGYAGFFLNVLAQDYYPRVAAVRDRPADLVRLINAQHRVLMIAGMPVVLGLIALAHILVPIVYSREFAPAVEVLEWQLTGDLLRFSSWVMSFMILARNGSATFLLTETVGGFTLLTASWFGLRWFGLPGIGMAFLVSSVVHNAVVTWIVRRDIALVWSSDNLRMIVAAFSAALIIRFMAVAGFSTLRTAVALAFFTAAVVNSVRLAYAELTTAPPDGLVSSTDSRLR